MRSHHFKSGMVFETIRSFAARVNKFCVEQGDAPLFTRLEKVKGKSRIKYCTTDVGVARRFLRRFETNDKSKLRQSKVPCEDVV